MAQTGELVPTDLGDLRSLGCDADAIGACRALVPWPEIRDAFAGLRIFGGKLPLKSLLRRVGSEFPHAPWQVAAEVFMAEISLVMKSAETDARTSSAKALPTLVAQGKDRTACAICVTVIDIGSARADDPRQKAGY